MRTNRVLMIGNALYPQRESSCFAGACFSPEGIAPTLNTMGGGNREPMVVVYESKDR